MEFSSFAVLRVHLSWHGLQWPRMICVKSNLLERHLKHVLEEWITLKENVTFCAKRLSWSISYKFA